MSITAALIGAPNCGKTTLYNRLTGGNARVGNYPGITVDTRSGRILPKYAQKSDITLTDLPGIYSLGGSTPEQKLARDALISVSPDVLIVLSDSTTPERSVALALELAELGIQMVVAFGMTDEAEKLGIRINFAALEGELGVPVLGICAPKDRGTRELVDAVLAVSHSPSPNNRPSARSIASKDTYFRRAEVIAARAVSKPPPRPTLTDRIDAVLLGRFTALPLFLVIVAAMFFVTFGRFGNILTRCIEFALSDFAAPKLDTLLASLGAADWVRSLISDGILGGVGGVLAFLPQIALLFLCLGLLEDSGYMARAAVLTDRPLRSVGLGGASFLPMFMGFGCTVAAELSSRTIPDHRERVKVCMAAPFISCAARWAVYAVVISAFFSEHRRLAAAGIYALGMIVTAIVSKLLGRSQSEDDIFLLELPPYRMPRLSNVWARLRERVCEFVTRAGTVIFLMSVLVWMLSRFDLHFAAAEPSDSILAALGRLLSPIFAPLGFGGWRESAALLSGLAAKEGVVSTLAVLYAPLPPSEALRAALDPAGACAFMAFCALYTPCVSALAAMARELRSVKLTLFALVMQLMAAYSAAVVVHLIASLLM